MTTAKEVATWMKEQMSESERLYQVEAVAGIESQFGSEFVYQSEVNELSINKNVLAHFRKLTGDDVVWVTNLSNGPFCPNAHWRIRQNGDTEIRTQYEDI